MEISAELVAAYVALREAGPHVLRWAPRVRDFVAGRAAATSAAVVSDAQAVHLRAQAHAVDVQADAQASATWATMNASLLARLDKVERAEKECQDRATAIERRAEEREKVLRAEAAAEAQALRTELLAAVVRAHQRATPSYGHSTVTVPADPLAETPPDGHRLVAPPVPLRDDPDPTPDLPSSLTPSRAKTDPPA